MNPISLAREYQTRAGDKVKLFTTGARDATYPVVGEICCHGSWECQSWTADGRFNGSQEQSTLDLVEVKPAARQPVPQETEFF